MALCWKNRIFFLLLLFLSFYKAEAQQPEGRIAGFVQDGEGVALPGISILVEGTGKGDATDVQGRFEIKGLKAGTYSLLISGIGYQKARKPLTLAEGESLELHLLLQEDNQALGEVLVEGKSQAEMLREAAYAVEVIETKKQKNLPMDLNNVLKATSGVHIRESGGMGSGFSLSLNGLSGNQIRYFIDGVPMENFGSSLTLNNFPVNLIENIEVYKGVVPVTLGADALGGAVNIVSSYRKQSFLDAAYSFGSFNTHKVSVNGQHASAKGYFVKLSSFINHSDNNYWMNDVPVYDELGNRTGNITIRRFHDQYTSGMGQLELGLSDKKLADQLSIGFTAAANRKDYQHPDNNILRVFGGFHTRNSSLLVNTTYHKVFGPLSLRTYVLAGRVRESIVDTTSRKYNWAGEYTQRPEDDPKGEIFERRSLFELNDGVFRSNLGLAYQLGPAHELNLNLTQNYLSRTGEDRVDPLNRSFESPNYINKNLLGLSYTLKALEERLEATVFGKGYWYRGRIITQDYEDKDITTVPELTSAGYGLAATYRFDIGLQLKSSFEKAYRIPEPYEILGDGIYVNPSPLLLPERSYNWNLGARLNRQVGELKVKSETNYFYRFSKDFIRFKPLGPFGTYENLQNVKSTGVEGMLGLNFRDFISFSTNVTYQHLTDRTPLDEGLPNTNYKSRVPNIPYFFGNVHIGMSPSKSTAANKLSFYWNTRYVHSFFLNWENLGNKNDKYIIPRQLTHDLLAEYSLQDGKYNLSLALNNLLNARVYDNFNIQKPGRAVHLKVRYFLK